MTAAEASWADLYLGEEVANRNVVDISRLQKLVITILLIIAYITWLWEKLGHGMPDGFVMPAPNDKFLWLLGLSHGAYLAYKATPKTVSS